MSVLLHTGTSRLPSSSPLPYKKSNRIEKFIVRGEKKKGKKKSIIFYDTPFPFPFLSFLSTTPPLIDPSVRNHPVIPTT